MRSALVGPLPVITYADGTRQAYTPPRNTLDLRYAACQDHHPACDCREALIAEDYGEFRAERAQVSEAFAAELAGHATWPPYDSSRDGPFQVCSCTGCRIARRCWWPRSPIETDQDRRACRVTPPREEVPF